MNKIVIFYFLLTMLINQAITQDLNCSCTHFSHSYFTVRPQFQIGSPEYISLFRNMRTRDNHSGLQLTIFGGRSTNKKQLGTFFSPTCDSCFIVDGTIKLNTESIFTQHFNLFSVKFSDDFTTMFVPNNVSPVENAFRSKITFKPEQSVIGLGMAYQYEFCIHDILHWISISGPIERVSNTMGIEEKIEQEGNFFEVMPLANKITNLNKTLRSMKEALVQDCWNFGKIDHKKRSKTRLAFIQVQIGQEWVDTDHCHFAPYFGITIPTGNTPKSKYVFEPIVGNGNHFGILWGFLGGIEVWKDNHHDIAINIENEIVMQYLFSKTHKRSVDLRNKPWSRYIEVYENNQQATQANDLGVMNLQSIFLASPGINLLTLDLKVKPGFNLTSNMAVVFAHRPYDSGLDAELGYNLYARQAECISLNKFCQTSAAIKDHVGLGVTNPKRNMSGDQLLNEISVLNLMTNGNFNMNGITDAYNKGVIKANDLDLSSAAHPCVIAHTVYGSFGGHFKIPYGQIISSIGGSYEFNSKMNTTMNRWLVWGKFGVNF